MTDMSPVIQPNSDQINADDLISGPITITIQSVTVRPGTEQPVSVNFGSPKVFRPCKSMCRVMVNAWGPNSASYAGKSMTLYRDPKVKWGGLEVGGIRISHMSDIDAPFTMALTESKANRRPFKVNVLAKSSAPAQSARLLAPEPPQAATDEDERADDQKSWADIFEHEIDTAADLVEFRALANTRVRSSEWVTLKTNDSERAIKLQDKVNAKLKELGR